MELPGWVIGFGLGSAAALIGRKLASVWNKNEANILAKGLELDNKAEAWIKNKWPWFELPDSMHATFDSIITYSVAFAHKYVGSAEFWRKVINLAYRTPEALPAEFAARFAEWVNGIDWQKNLNEQIPEWLKPIVNQAKEETAVRLTENKIAALEQVQKLNVAPNEKRANIIMAIRSAAAANKVSEDLSPVTKETLERLIEESKKRQEALATKK